MSTSATRPFSPFEWMLAGRYLRARRKEGFISIIAGFSFLGILLGVATLIIVMAVMNGFRNELFAKILGVDGHVFAHKKLEKFSDYDETIQRLQAAPGVVSAIPVVQGQVMVSSPSQATGAFVYGHTEKSLMSLPLVAKSAKFGSFDGFDTQAGVAIGTRLASTLGVSAGDNITLISPRGSSTPFGTAPRTKSYVVSTVFELGMSEYDRVMVLMPIAEAQKFFGRPGEADYVQLLVADPENVQSYMDGLREAAGPTIQLSDWRARNETYFTVLEVEKNMMFIILSLIVLVAALNIISGLMMLVKDKGRDIAVLRTMGATKGAVMRVFLITGASIGVVGTLAGFVLGVVFCNYIDEIRQFVAWATSTAVFDPNIYFLNKMPAEIDVRQTAWIVAMAMALSVLATLYPSWRASKLDPVEALRYE